MSPAQVKVQRKITRKMFFRKWHRRIGFAASLFLLILASTGILLNHYESLALHQHYIQSTWILDWYGVKQPQKIHCIKSSSTICQVGSHLYSATQQTKLQLLSSDATALRMVINSPSETYIVTDTRVDIYNPDFQLIESLDRRDELNRALINGILSENDHSKAALNQVVEPVNSQLKQVLSDQYRRQQITYLKFIQDLHSGQLFNLPGKLFTDLLGITLLILAISGFITWQRRKKLSSD